jgi:hypothetical protein
MPFLSDHTAVYYHTVLLTFRPFLIAHSEKEKSDSIEVSVAAQNHSSPFDKEDLWLRKACRLAIDAAQDNIVYIHHATLSLEACKVSSTRVRKWSTDWCSGDIIQ